MKIPYYISKSAKSKSVRKVINEAIFILAKLGIPIKGMTQRKLERMALSFLAVANVKTSKDWSKVKGIEESLRALKTREIINYINAHFQENISSGSYDDIRRKDLKFPVVAGIIVRSAGKPNSARNDPTRAYALSQEYAELIRGFGQEAWEKSVEEFFSTKGSLAEQLGQRREIQIYQVTLSQDTRLELSYGEHNQPQKAIIEIFLPRFGYGAEVLYVGDTANKFLYINRAKLNDLQFFELSHGELPDILAYSLSKNWLFVIEAVHSSGAISPLRLLELKTLTKECIAGLVFVTAFSDRATFRKFIADIAWETEVWIADEPDHLIHFDGEKFLGPYKSN